MVKIALKGYARSGKDTVAQMMVDYLETKGHGYARDLAFGDVLKVRFHDAFPTIPLEPKPREAYEKFGQLGRTLDEDMWVKETEREMKAWEHVIKNFIISDLRQPNEGRWCRENGFIIVEVWSPDNIRKTRSNGDTVFVPINESEERLHEIEHDFTIYNMDDIKNLENQVTAIMEVILNETTPNRRNETSGSNHGEQG